MKNEGALSQNHLNFGIKTYLNGTLTSNILIETSQVATDTAHRPKRHYRKLHPGDPRSAPGACNTSTQTPLITGDQPIVNVYAQYDGPPSDLAF